MLLRSDVTRSSPAASMNQPLDPMAPATRPEDARVGPLRRVTIAVADAPAAAAFFAKHLHLRARADGPDGSSFLLDAPATPGAIEVGIVASPQGQLIRPGMDATLDGGLSIGFPVASLEGTLARVTAAGVRSTAGIVSLTMKRADGSEYTSGEIMFCGPDDVYVLVVGRPPDLAPVGPIDPATGVGGATYSALVVPDSEREIAFYTGVLGWELRRNVEVESSGPGGGLGLPAGTRFRFIQLFAPGAMRNYIVLLDLMGAGRRNPVAPRLPNRGLVAWTFASGQFDAVAHAASRSSAAGSMTIKTGRDAAAGVALRTLSMLTPAGLRIHVAERK
jgi:catechol 2,3-dioxygenase-like lactoylglutathione lyase family enzyme